MASIFLTSALEGVVPPGDWALGPLRLFRWSAEHGSPGEHRLAANPRDADVVLFAGGGRAPVLAHVRGCALYREFWKKSYVFVPNDRPLPLIPGLYASLEKGYHDPEWSRGGFYVHMDEHDRFHAQPFDADTDLLFSFVGSATNAEVRRHILTLQHPRIRLEDTSGRVLPAFVNNDREAIARLHENYVETTRRSRFVLCPRGEGVSSMRLFETMRMARCPVILGDDWVPPDGPDWDACAIQVPESDWASLPMRLEAIEHEARSRGELARREWERWFSSEQLFQTVAGVCLDLHRLGAAADRTKRLRFHAQRLRPHYLKAQLRHAWKARQDPATSRRRSPQ